MPSPLRSVGRCLLLIALAWNITPVQAPKALPPDDNTIASLPPEVRLRKLHLVRPDLIPFPIAYEVCC
jgi:hypothetical protein